MNMLGSIETFWQDVRYALRVLRKSPSTTMVALFSLALGISATTAIFSVFYGVLISPYPYARPGEIWAPAILNARNPKLPFSFYRLRDYAEVKKLPAFADAMATLPENRLLTGERAPETFQAISVTANAFRFLGVPPVLGRTILPSDLGQNGEPNPVIVLSYKAWGRLFDSSPDALGKKLILNDEPFTVIGVMPPRFGWWTNEGGWVVLPENRADNRSAAAIVRLKPGISAPAAEQQLQALNLELAHAHPADFPKNGFTTRLHNYLDVTVASGEMQSSLQLLFGAVGFLLLIACANVANLQMARATGRAHEISVRMSLGAARKRLLRQLLTESMVLSLVGGAVGVLLAVGITKAVVALMPDFYVPNEARITVNGYVLLFSAAVSLLTGILFGLAPAIRSSRPNLVDALKEAGRASGSGAGGRTRHVLVVAEIALSVVLLMGASLTVRGFQHLQSVDPGFQTGRLLMVGLQLPPKRYATYDERIRFSERVLEAVSTIPGVQSVAIGNGGLPYAAGRSPYSIVGQTKDESRQFALNLVSSGYAQTLGIPLRAGRDLTPAEVAHAEPVALVNEEAVKLWAPGANPIGSRVHLDFLEKPPAPAPASSTPEVTIVGVIGNVRNDGLNSPVLPAVYLPYTLLAPAGRTLALRTQAEPMGFLNAVRERIRGIDKEQPLGRPITMEEVIGSETVQPRFNMALFSFFGFLGLALAAFGIYSMLSYTVARRTREIGIRMALGAVRGDVLRLMLRMGGRLVLIGLAVGLAGSLALDRVLRSEVLQVPGTDPVAISAVMALLATAALLACLGPAWRAAQLDPMSALRHE
jgi:putative ABC transport system permease protein